MLPVGGGQEEGAGLEALQTEAMDSLAAALG